MIVIATGFIPPSPLSIVSAMIILETIQWPGRNVVRSTGKKNSIKVWVGVPAVENNVDNGVKQHTVSQSTFRYYSSLTLYHTIPTYNDPV